MILAGTGHRPDKLGGYSEDVYNRLVDLAVVIIDKYKPDEVVSGMALGWDFALAEAAFYTSTPLCCAIPFAGQECRWSQEDQEKYREALERCGRVKIVCEGGYAPWKMQKRNEWMVDECDRVIALWNGADGGTANCIRYAKKVGKPISNFWSSWEKYK